MIRSLFGTDDEFLDESNVVSFHVEVVVVDEVVDHLERHFLVVVVGFGLDAAHELVVKHVRKRTMADVVQQPRRALFCNTETQ